MIQAISYGTGSAATGYAQSISGNTAVKDGSGTTTENHRSAQKTTSANAGSSGIIYDKKDLNKDGFVSYVEELIYAYLHPGETTESRSADSTAALPGSGSYNSQGSLNSNTSQSLIDITV